MSNDHDAKNDDLSLSGQMANVFERALEKLKDDPDEKFFPEGVAEISVSISGDPPAGQLRISATAQAPSGRIVDYPDFWIRPMFVFPSPTCPGQMLNLNVAVNGKRQTLSFAAGGWSVVDLDSASGWTVSPSPFAPPAVMPNGKMFWIWVWPAKTGEGPVRINNIPIDGATWFLQDPAHATTPTASTPWPAPSEESVTGPQPKPKLTAKAKR